MTLLFLATRAPWPSTDGGRVLMARTLDGLRARGHVVTLVAPMPVGSRRPEPPAGDGLRTILVPVRPRPLLAAVARSLIRRRPGSVMRHYHPEVARAVSDLLQREHVDLVHVEQLHALPHAEPALTRGVPVVLRAENVESDLWRLSAASRPWWRIPAGWEASKLARWEREALGRVAVTAAVTESDADRLRHLSPSSRIEVVRIPMPRELPAGQSRLDGAPAIALLAGPWFPNHDGVTWFLRAIWPAVVASLPGARLHVFGQLDVGNARPGVVRHPAPDDVREAFALGSIFVVPLRIASGASVKILDAWARGVPVVATPTATAGLDGHDSASIGLARTPAEFVSAFTTLMESTAAVDRAVAAGRAVLTARHDPARIAADLDRVYAAAIDTLRDRRGSS